VPAVNATSVVSSNGGFAAAGFRTCAALRRMTVVVTPNSSAISRSQRRRRRAGLREDDVAARHRHRVPGPGIHRPQQRDPHGRENTEVQLLVTGAAGYLGSELRRQRPDVLATFHDTLDVNDGEAVMRCFIKHGPDVVVHTAYRMGDAETNVRGAHNVALAAHRVGARLLHLSTDLVFDGEHGAPYSEDDEPRPVMEYGQQKLEAEQLVRRAHPQALIVRTSLLVGPPDGAQEALARRDDVTFFEDEIRSPLQVRDLASALLELAELDLGGILHVAGPEAISRAELAERLRGGPVRSGPGPRTGRARNVALDSSRATGLLKTRIGRSA
jgi:dTDP-4-dehydrorhamnose reductase